ncbi:L-seryl-tRNA(Sec) selenium transferase [Lichenicola sp.]|uniref:L-seryl-tRNA(Sec) selenium transferase n=1 Tax=Lichenicola sp. TaxID=2804529 RepID=UPI003AFF7E52
MRLDRTIGDQANLRALPQVQRLLESPLAASLQTHASRPVLLGALRAVLDQARAQLRADPALVAPTVETLLAAASDHIAASDRPGLRRVINATGIVLHTNLGRAPLAQAALDAVVEAGRGYGNLEFDLAAGHRGSRTQGIEPLLVELTGAEAALAVNNAAAAVLLALSALAGGGGGEVIVSRGELVEIGGGFRIPDVIRQGGARLVEVGTTNKTRIADYADAITPQTRMLLKVHQSNYRITGFTAEASIPELSVLAKAHGLVLMHDLGSGALVDLRRFGRPYEPTVQEALAAGADLVAFSGDKLMGGPQAGMLVGNRAAVDPLRRHPLLRAVRLDKMSLAALEATLRLYRDPEAAIAQVPALRMLAQDQATLAARAGRLHAALDGVVAVGNEPSTGFAGGGTLPDTVIPSHAVTLHSDSIPPEQLAMRLRLHHPAVVGRLAGGQLLLDMLTVSDDELPELAAAIRAVLHS